MRGLLRSKALTIVAAIVSFTAIPAVGIVATATPALASVTICNTFGNRLCVGDPAPVNNADPVVLTVGGRNMTELDQHFTCCGGFEVVRLSFDANPTQCIGVAASLNVTVRDCSGGNANNTNWARVPISNGVEWFSNTLNRFLTSDNRLGHQLFASTADSQRCINGGCFFVWTG
jgi:hypothetical protein